MTKPSAEETGKKLDHLNAMIARLEGIFEKTYGFGASIPLTEGVFEYKELIFEKNAHGSWQFAMGDNNASHPLRSTAALTRIRIVCDGYLTALQAKLEDGVRERHDGVDKAIATATALIAELER
jgi:hypothetical protein